MAEQTRAIRVSTIRQALRWYRQMRGTPSLLSYQAYIELQSALDSDEYTAQLEAQVQALTERLEKLERRSVVYGPLAARPGEVGYRTADPVGDRTLGGASAPRE